MSPTRLGLTPRGQAYVALTLILLLATFLRVYRIDQLPPGLHYDEAFNATMAYRVWTGIERPIFFTEDLTEEPMAIYLTALAFALFGETTWAIRLVSAVAGILTVVAVYWLARALFQSRRVALLAAFTLAILYWHVNFSRLGMEPIFTPLVMTLAFAFLWRALNAPPTAEPNARRIGWFILAGIFFGATLYTYKASLFVPILASAFIASELGVTRQFWARHGRGLIICASVAVLVFAPLGLYLAAHPSEFLERPASVAATSSTPTLLDNTHKVAGMIFIRGDENPRSNLPLRPALDPFLAFGLIAGVIASSVNWRKPAARLLLLWLSIMSLPSVVTDFAPHFGRSIGVTPVLALLVAFGLAALGRWACQTRGRQIAFVVLLCVGLTFSASMTARDYFAGWGAQTGLFESFDVGYLALAQRLRAQPAAVALYLSPVEQQHYTIQFGLARRDARSFDGRRVFVVPPPGARIAYGIVTREDDRTRDHIARIFGERAAQPVETIRDFAGNPYAEIVRVEGAPRIAPQKFVRARIGDAIELIGYDRAREGNTLVLTVYWGSIAETREDYTVFVHLLGALNPATQSPVWAQTDTRPGRGTFPTARWQTGEVVLDEYRLTLPTDAPPGDYPLAIGMYNLETGARVRVLDASGVPMESDRVLLERISFP